MPDELPLSGERMPRSILRAAGLTFLAAGCATPNAAPLPEGLAFECTPGGAASIAFNGGGYLPESRVWGTRDGERAQVWRSGATLSVGGQQHRMIAEWVSEGLRYRSERPHDGTHYLVWTMGGEGRGAEDALLGQRAQADAGGDEPGDAGAPIAECRRAGRGAAPRVAEAPHQG